MAGGGRPSGARLICHLVCLSVLPRPAFPEPAGPCTAELVACSQDVRCRHSVLSMVGLRAATVPTAAGDALDALVDCAAVAQGSAATPQEAAAKAAPQRDRLRLLGPKPLLVGKPPPASEEATAKTNRTFGVPCIHTEAGFHTKRPLLTVGHSSKKLVPHQRRDNFPQCWYPNCFRGVFDNFASDAEADALSERLKPLLDSDAAGKQQFGMLPGAGAEGYIGYPLGPRVGREDSEDGGGEHPVIHALARRMATYLREHFGVQGAVPASTNARSMDYRGADPGAAQEREARFERDVSRDDTPHPPAQACRHWFACVRGIVGWAGEGAASVGALPPSPPPCRDDTNCATLVVNCGVAQFVSSRWNFRSSDRVSWHWDNAVKLDWLYTCLLYFGTTNVTHGATVFVDRSSPGGYLTQGLAVEHRRNRLVSSGAAATRSQRSETALSSGARRGELG
jgi:hypothetical protein